MSGQWSSAPRTTGQKTLTKVTSFFFSIHFYFKKQIFTLLLNINEIVCIVGYNEFDFFKEKKEPRPFDGCKI